MQRKVTAHEARYLGIRVKNGFIVRFSMNNWTYYKN
jgi:hypothetical protein